MNVFKQIWRSLQAEFLVSTQSERDTGRKRKGELLLVH